MRAPSLWFAFALLLAIVAPPLGCSGDAPGQSEQQAAEAFAVDAEVLLTAPYCDVCSDADKQLLTARSAIVARTVALIDAASSRVDIAQFTFSVKPIAQALLRARDRGVTVRLAMDAAQDQPGTRARELFDAGIDVRFVKGRLDAGLQHAKFMLVDDDVLVTSSHNLSSTGTTINEENAIVVRAAPQHLLLLGFRCQFEAIWASQHDAAGACSNELVSFAPSSLPRKMIRDRLRAATRSIDVIMHHFTFGDLVKELTKAAKERGVRVRVLLNETTKDEHAGKAWQDLIAAGGSIRYKRVNADLAQLMHHKLAIIDDSLVVNGSGNWSGNAFFDNFEAYVTWKEPRVVRPMRGLFARLWDWSLSADSLAAGRDAAEQHALATRPFFGNLHAHIEAHVPTSDGERALDDGKPERLDAAGNKVPVASGASLADTARLAIEHARDVGGLDFFGLSPHCRDDVPGDNEANMSEDGFGDIAAAAEDARDESFLPVASMEWSTYSHGNHVGIIGASEIAKVERGRFDRLYEEWLPERERAGDRPFVMLNHPRTFRENLAPSSGTSPDPGMEGGWDVIFGTSLSDVPKASERNKKFNDYGVDDFSPLRERREAWIAGSELPDPAAFDETLTNLWSAASPYLRLMEVTLNRGTEFGSLVPQNPSLVPSKSGDGTIERLTKVHDDWDFFLSRGWRVAPVASHDNHMANWGAGHTSRTGVIAERLGERELLDAIDQRKVYASEDPNLALGFYVAGRVPMGGETASPSDTVAARVLLADPDYAGTFVVRVYHGIIGKDGVTMAQELTDLAAGRHDLSLALGEAGTHFFYLEIVEPDADRMAWSAPIWIERL